MKNAEFTKFIPTLLFLASVLACGKKETAADFDNICQNEDQAQITIKGFLRKPNADSNELLLFENANGTGGFIQIQPNYEGVFSNALPLEISGEILKKDNSCVLQIKKIEGF